MTNTTTRQLRRIKLNHRFDLIHPAPGWERQIGAWLVDRIDDLSGGPVEDRIVYDTIEIDGEWSYRVDPFQPARLETRLDGEFLEAATALGLKPDDLIANVRWTTGCGGRVRGADEWERYVDQEWIKQQGANLVAEAGKLAEALRLDYPRITTTYDIVTPESAKEGDVAESGFEDEIGHDCRPDDYDIDDGNPTPVHVAVAFLDDKCLDSGGGPGSYYEADGTTDYKTGENTRRAYHLEGFTDREAAAVADAIGQRLDLWRGEWGQPDDNGVYFWQEGFTSNGSRCS